MSFKRSTSGLTNSKIEKLPNSLEQGRVLCITASALPNCQRWTVNLLCGSSYSADLAFHFNPRLLQHYVVRNSRLKGQWGIEETLSKTPFPIKAGEEFQVKFFATDKEFFVTYNDQHICSFAFRIDPSTITHVEVSGMVDIYKISMETFDKYPTREEHPYILKETGKLMSMGEDINTPVRTFLPDGLQEDWQLEIYGTPKILPQSFSVILSSEVHVWPQSTIPLQLNANFGNNMLVRNAFIDNKWGTEERIGGFKFLPASSFALWIRRTTRKYSIWVNEKLQAEFGFRCDPDVVKAIHIEGDVKLTGIYINKNPEKYFYGS